MKVRHGGNKAKKAGAQGSSSSGTVAQQADSSSGLLEQLQVLRMAMASSAVDRDDYVVLGALAEAEEAVSQQDEERVKKSLAKAGKTAIQTAREIGVEVAAAAISRSMGGT